MANETNSVYVERLEQALRVMRGLSEHERTKHFDLSVFARETPCGTVACIAGYCGLDPWFRERGLVTEVAAIGNPWSGDVSQDLQEFFGTERPFFPMYYPKSIRDNGVTYEDAVAALEQAITEMRS